MRNFALTTVIGLCTICSSLRAQEQSVDWRLYNPGAHKELPDTNVAISTPDMPDYDGPGKVNFYQDPRINLLSDKYKEVRDGKIEGYSILIYYSETRDEMRQKRAKFRSLFPDHTVEDDWQDPLYKLYGGSFHTKLEAEKALQDFKVHFPGSVYVKRKVTLPNLVEKEEEMGSNQ